ncbi:MAG: response regulator [Desulfoferrobacter sp.]
MYRILLVDDDRLVLDIVRDMLLFKGYKVTAFYSSKRVLELIADNNPYDLVMTDLRMPEVDGFGIAKASKAKNPERPVIVYSGWAADYEDEDLTGKGVDLLLPKPITMGVLFKSVEMLISRAGN